MILVRKTIILSIILFISGCSNYSHHENVELVTKTISFDSIEGTYSNKGLSPSGVHTKSLSKFIFPDYNSHQSIEKIKVVVDGSNVICTAIDSSGDIFSKTYIEGEHFSFEGNRILLSSNLSCFSCDEAGAMHFGIGIKNQSLYLTTNGDALLRSNEKGVAAIILMPIPFPLIEESDALFRREENH